MADKVYYTDLFEYANDASAQLAWVTNTSKLELDYMEYANDGAAQAAYVTSASGAPAPKLLLHLNNNVTDSSPSGHTVTNNGVAFDAGTKKWGSHSALFVAAETDDLSIPDSNDWDVFGSNSDDWTIDLWINSTSALANYKFIEQYQDSDNIMAFSQNFVGRYKFNGILGGVVKVTLQTDAAVALTGWHHLATIKKGNEYGIYLDGNQVAYTTSNNTMTLTGSLYIGQSGGGSEYVDGHMDEIRIIHDNPFSASPNVGKTDTITVPTGEHSASAGSPYLQSYSESTIKNQGIYSLKGIAAQTGSLNDTLTKSGLSINLSNKNTLKFDCYASRTGTNLQLQIHDSGGQTSTKDIAISSANTWETTTWDISGISNANKDNIDKIIIKIINADSANTFYIDNFYASADLQCYSEATIIRQGTYSLKVISTQTGSLNKTLTKTLTDYLDYSICDVIKFDIRASRTGTNLQIQIHDTGGVTSTHNINIASANTWQIEEWDISGIATASRDTIDKIIIKVTEASAANTIYVDNLYSEVIVQHSYVWMG